MDSSSRNLILEEYQEENVPIVAESPGLMPQDKSSTPRIAPVLMTVGQKKHVIAPIRVDICKVSPSVYNEDCVVKSPSSQSNNLSIENSSGQPNSAFTPSKKKRSLRLLISFHSDQMVTQHNDRIDFIKKIFAIVSLQFLLNIIFISIMISSKTLKNGIKDNVPAIIFCLIMILILIFSLIFWLNDIKKDPYNKCFYIVFTILESYFFIYMASVFNAYSVLAACLMVFGITSSLTIYSYRNSTDFDMRWGMIFGIISSIIFLGISLSFAYKNFLEIIYSFLTIIGFCFYIIYDVGIIAGGRFQSLNYDDYFIASILLYIDVVGIFIYIITLVKEGE